MFRDINDEVFEGYGDRLEEEEFEGSIRQPFLEHEVTREVEKSREEKGDVELGIGRPIRTAREPQKPVRNESSQPRELLINMIPSEQRITEEWGRISYRSQLLVPRLPKMRLINRRGGERFINVRTPKVCARYMRLSSGPRRLATVWGSSYKGRHTPKLWHY